MKRRTMKPLCVASVVLLALAFLAPTVSVYAKTCTGSAGCTACKNCTGCKHCAQKGGTCGVCKPAAKKKAGAKPVRQNHKKRKP